MLTVVCVLKGGGDYRPEHVHALRDGVARNLTTPHQFVCLTDMAVDCDHLWLLRGWPGWWSKMELFDGRITGPTLYLDLDTIITGPLDEIVIGHTFTVLRNFWAVEYNEPNRIGSGLMAWDEDLSAIYKTFASKPDHFLCKYKTKGGSSTFIRAHFGDQMFIQHHTPILMERWQDKFPGKVVSFKKHVLPNGGVPKGASICCFHGVPRPWNLKPHERAWFDEVREAA